MSAPSVARVSSSARGARVGKERYGHPVATAIEASALADSRTSRVSMRSQPFAPTARGDALGTEPGPANYSP